MEAQQDRQVEEAVQRAAINLCERGASFGVYQPSNGRTYHLVLNVPKGREWENTWGIPARGHAMVSWVGVGVSPFPIFLGPTEPVDVQAEFGCDFEDAEFVASVLNRVAEILKALEAA